MNLPRLTIRSLRAVPVMVPMHYALGTSAATVRSAPLLLVDLDTHEGVTGHAYQFCYRAAAAPAIIRFLDDILDAVKSDVVAPADLWVALSKRYTLIGVQGIVRMAMSLVDVACWDALAQAAGLPLAPFLGGALRPVPAYNSNGLGLMPAAALADEAEKLLDGGFRAVKLRLGYPTVEEDVAAVRAVRTRIPGEVALMVDYNQALGVADAISRACALDGEGIYWIEEPIRHDHRLAARERAGCSRRHADVVAPLSRGQRPPAGRDTDRALARIRGLDGAAPGRAAQDCGRHGDTVGLARRGAHVE